MSALSRTPALYFREALARRLEIESLVGRGRPLRRRATESAGTSTLLDVFGALGQVVIAPLDRLEGSFLGHLPLEPGVHGRLRLETIR